MDRGFYPEVQQDMIASNKRVGKLVVVRERGPVVCGDRPARVCGQRRIGGQLRMEGVVRSNRGDLDRLQIPGCSFYGGMEFAAAAGHEHTVGLPMLKLGPVFGTVTDAIVTQTRT